MKQTKPGYIVALLVLAIILGSVAGIIMMYGGKKADSLAPQPSEEQSDSSEPSPEEMRAEIARVIQEFLSSPPPAENGKLLELYRYMTSKEPVITLFWPSGCSSCRQYKSAVWDKVKEKFDNATFIDYDISDPEGATIASRLKIPGITIVLTYNGTVYAVFSGEHVPEEYLEYMVRILVMHAER